jgi:hypothetical protein
LTNAREITENRSLTCWSGGTGRRARLARLRMWRIACVYKHFQHFTSDSIGYNLALSVLFGESLVGVERVDRVQNHTEKRDRPSFFLDCRTGVMAGSAKWRKQLRNIGQRWYRYCLRFEPMPRWPLNCPDVTYAIISHEVEKIAQVSRRRLFP